MLKPILPQIPEELKKYNQWVCWEGVWNEKKGKHDKIPYNPLTGYKAKANVPSTWASFDDTSRVYQQSNGKYAGIGFELLKSDPFTGVDLDDCIDDLGVIAPWAWTIIRLLNSYTELSPSGKGLRIFVKAELNASGRRKEKIEVYTDGRFLTVTGHHLEGTPVTIEHRQLEMDQFHKGYIAKPAVDRKQTEPAPALVDDAAILDKARRSKNGDKFSLLFDRGDWQKAGFPSQSEADLALANMLAFWCGRDAGRMESLFRMSALYREKCDKPHYSGGETYLEWTVKKAIADCNEVYQPGGKDGAIKDFSDSQKKNFRFSDTGNAERLVYYHGEDLRYDFTSKSWYVWDGKRWREDLTGEINRRAVDTVKRMKLEAASIVDDSLRRAMGEWASKSDSDSRIRAMINQARSIQGVPVLPDEFDKDRWLLNVLNGTIDLKTGQLRPHDRKDLMIKICQVYYDPSAKCPRWLTFLDRVMGAYRFLPNGEIWDKHRIISFLKRFVGYCLTGETNEQVFAFCYGPGGNGKTCFVTPIQRMLGDYSKTVPTEDLMLKNKGSSGPNPSIARLPGSRFVVASETDQGSRLSEALIKQLTGQDRFATRGMYSSTFEFNPTFKLLLYGNHRPVIRGGDKGIWRRVLLIPFEVTINPDERDEKLLDKLLAELPGILNWALEGCIEWQREGLNPPPEVLLAVEEYRSEMDLINQFLNECCIKAEHVSVKSSDLYTSYKNWCISNGLKPLSQQNLRTQLSEKGLQYHHTKVARFWRGIDLTDEIKQENRWGGSFIG